MSTHKCLLAGGVWFVYGEVKRVGGAMGKGLVLKGCCREDGEESSCADKKQGSVEDDFHI